MAKPEKKAEARQYREQGKSIIWIADRLQVSKSSVSTWVRDIALSEEQEAALRFSNERRDAQIKGAEANIKKHRAKRLAYQEEGRVKARTGDPLHLAGCMLYWAEGSKNRNSVEIVNSDVDMLVYFMRFLRESLNVQEPKFRFRVNAYLNNDLTQTDIIDYWMNKLNLTSVNLNKSSFNKQPSSSKQQGRKLPYGVCEININSTRLSQHIYGAIQEYTGIKKPEWLD
ncbi:MAG: hypothetical protein WBC91_19015 [Phototrophicaceae bacterium]